MFDETLKEIDKLTEYIIKEDRSDGFYWKRLNCVRDLIIDLKSEFEARNKLI